MCSMHAETPVVMGRRTRVFGQVQFNKQNSDSGTVAGGSDFEGWILTVGATHTFEPIKLW